MNLRAHPDADLSPEGVQLLSDQLADIRGRQSTGPLRSRHQCLAINASTTSLKASGLSHTNPCEAAGIIARS